jgi:Mg2+ and Co2+ transporter CorA
VSAEQAGFTSDFTHGSRLDSCVPGFIGAYLFDADGHAIPVADTALADAFQSGRGWIWLHLNLSDRRCAKWIAQTAGVDTAISGDFSEPSQRQVISRRNDILLGHLADFRRDFDADSAEPAWLHFILGGRFVITGRSSALQSAEAMRRLIARGASYATPTEFLIALVSQFADTLDVVMHDLLDEMEIIEDHILDERHRGERRRLMLLRRQAAMLHRHMRAMRRALLLADRTLPEFPEGFQGLIGRLHNLDQDFEMLEARARFFHDEIDAKLTAETNRQLYALSALTAAFLPPALVASLFGMNFSWLPWQNASYGFWIAVTLCVVSSLAVLIAVRIIGRN